MKNNLKLISSLGIGLLPLPGITSTILGLSIVYFIPNTPLRLSIIILLFITGVILGNLVEKKLALHDPHFFILDEVLGAAVSVCLLPPNFIIYFLAFIIFRLLDNLKPFPINYLQKHLPGGWGIMVDDLIAGIITLLILYYV